MDAKVLRLTQRVIEKLYKVHHPTCLIYFRRDCYLIQPTALYGRLALAAAGEVVRLDRDVNSEQVGEAALAALTAYQQFPDAPPLPPKKALAPLLRAAGVKTAAGLSRASTLASVERVGQRLAVVPHVWRDSGGHERADERKVICGTRAKPLGEAIYRVLAEHVGVDRYHRDQYQKHLPEIKAEQRAVIGVKSKIGRQRMGQAKAGRRPAT